MRTTLVLVIALVVLAMAATTKTTTQAPLVPLSLSLSLANYNLIAGKVGYVEVKVCNPINSVVLGTSVSVISNDTTVLNVSIPIGNLKPSSCKVTKVYLVPTRSFAHLKISAMGYSPLLKRTVQGYASFNLRVKSPKLVVKPNPISYPNPLTLRVTNVGDVAFDGKVYVYLNGRMASWSKLAVEPNQSTEVKLKLPPLPKGPWPASLKFKMGNFIITKQIVINVLDSPIKFEIQGPKIDYCLPTPAILNIKASSGIPSPTETLLYKCGSLSYSVESPTLPLSLTFELKSPYFTLKKVIKINDIVVKANTTAIYSYSTNAVELSFMAPVPLIGSASISSNSPINPASAIVRTNSTLTINIIGTNNPTVVKVKVFGKEYSLNFNVIEYSPVISFYVKPNVLVEGSISKVKVCVKNAWVKTLKSVTLVVTKPVNSQTYLGSLSPGQSSCLTLNVTVPWGAKDVTISGYAQGLGFKREFQYKILVVPSPYVAILTISSDKNFLNVGINNVTITIKNIGKGWAKGVKLTFDAPDLVAPTQYYLGDLRPHSEKKVRLEFSIPPDRRKENLKVGVSYCSGPLEGPCLETKQNFSLFFGVGRYLPPLLQLNAPTALSSGKTSNITITIKNVGKSKAIAPTITFSNGKYVSITGPNVFALSDIGPGKEVKLTISLSAQAVFSKKRDKISYEIKYSDEWGNEYNKKGALVFILKPVNEAKVVVNLLTSNVPVGNGMLKFILSNVGTKAARDITVMIYADGISVKKDKFVIRALGPKQSVVIQVPVSAPPSSAGNLASVGVSVSYGGQTESFSYNVKIVNGPQIDVTDLSVTPRALVPGMTGTISFSIVNSGDQPAYRVRAKVYLPLQLSALGPTDVLVGVVKQQSAVPVAFLFKVKGEQPGTYPIKVVVTYTYQGVEYKKEVSTTVIIKPKSLVPGQSFVMEHPLLVGGGVVAALFLAIIVAKVKRGKKEPEEGEAIDVE